MATATIVCRVAALVLISAIGTCRADAIDPSRGVRPFAVRDVELLESPFLSSMRVNRTHLLKHDPDRLLAPFLDEAGLKPRAPGYGNWEGTGLGGHTGGHYLSALAYTAAALDDATCRERLEYMVSELARCQAAHGDGYIGGVPNSRELWEQVRLGDIRASGFALNDRWVPFYNLHKTYAGLRDAYLVAGVTEAKPLLVGLSDWCLDLLSGLSDEQVQAILACEHGGMNEVLADTAAITDDDRYLLAAERFSHEALLEPLSAGRDELDGWHANTQVPKVIGFQRIAALGGPARYHTAAEFFWRTVVENRTIAIGGNSVAEHFPSARRSIDFVTDRQGPETCNTYNMLRLTKQLFEQSPEARYIDYYERALYNHILSSHHPEHGGYVYFTSARPRHYRVYSQAEQCFWCCVGSGMENHTRYGEFIYAHDDESLYVNLFIPSRLDWAAKGLKLTQTTQYPDEPISKIELSLKQPQRFALRVRRPGWARGSGWQLVINGESADVGTPPQSYAVIDRTWQDGDRVEVRLPMSVGVEPLPHLDHYVALTYGPVVLAAATGAEDLDGLVAGDARMDHVASGPLLPLNEAPMLVCRSDEIASLVDRLPAEGLAFRFTGGVQPERYGSLRLVPFHRVHDTRYQIYWRQARPEEYADLLAAAEAAEQARIELDRITIDHVAPGEQQPESEHHFRGEGTSTGVWRDRRFRHADGWFSYDLNTNEQRDLTLRLTYFGSDRRDFDILINGELLAEVHLAAPQPGEFFDRDYPLSEEHVAAAQDASLTVTFRAKPGSMAGGIFDVRLLRKTEQAE